MDVHSIDVVRRVVYQDGYQRGPVFDIVSKHEATFSRSSSDW